MRFLFFLWILCSAYFANGQRNNVWCFGDSVKINFNGGTVNPQPFCPIYSAEQSSSISDFNGSMQFYIGAHFFNNPLRGTIWNKNDQVMQGGDSIYANSTVTNGTLIIPMVNDTNRYYILSISTPDGYLFYSIVDMSLNGGLGAVVIKNQPVVSTSLSEKLSAVKHANGKDWWVLAHKIYYTLNDTTNTFYRILIDSSGISQPDSQSIGNFYTYTSSFHLGQIGEMLFSNDGTRLTAVGFGIIDLFDFNRCTGELSNWKALAPSSFNDPEDDFYGCSFSPDGSKLYVSNTVMLNTGFLYQFDLEALNIQSSRVTLWTNNIGMCQIGQHQLGPDNKIYISTGYGNLPVHYDTAFNRNLSVINYPDSGGLSCGLQLFSVPVGIGKTILGLPNFPNYYLSSSEVNCDSVNNANDIESAENSIKVVPNPNTGNFTLMFECNKVLKFSVFICDIVGRPVYNIDNISFAGTNSTKIEICNLNTGVYFLELTSEVRRKVIKVVVE